MTLFLVPRVERFCEQGALGRPLTICCKYLPLSFRPADGQLAVLGKLVSSSETSDVNPWWWWHKGDNRYPKRGLCLLVFSPLYDQIPDKKQEGKLILISGLRIWSIMAGKAQRREWLSAMPTREWGHLFRGWGREEKCARERSLGSFSNYRNEYWWLLPFYFSYFYLLWAPCPSTSRINILLSYISLGTFFPWCDLKPLKLRRQITQVPGM